MHINPAAKIIKKFATNDHPGTYFIARLLGITQHAVRKWRVSKDSGGSDGVIPEKYRDIILRYANSKKIKMTAKEFLKMR
jgi:hypothetical protein